MEVGTRPPRSGRHRPGRGRRRAAIGQYSCQWEPSAPAAGRGEAGFTPSAYELRDGPAGDRAARGMACRVFHRAVTTGLSDFEPTCRGSPGGSGAPRIGRFFRAGRSVRGIVTTPFLGVGRPAPRSLATRHDRSVVTIRPSPPQRRGDRGRTPPPPEYWPTGSPRPSWRRWAPMPGCQARMSDSPPQRRPPRRRPFALDSLEAALGPRSGPELAAARVTIERCRDM